MAAGKRKFATGGRHGPRATKDGRKASFMLVINLGLE
jgi:hypothetical protein